MHTDDTIKLVDPSDDTPGWIRDQRWREQPLIIVGIALLAAGLAAAFFLPADEAPTAAPAPTPALHMLVVATPTPAMMYEIVPAPPTTLAQERDMFVLPRAVVAYNKPDGEPLGALDAGRSYRPLARSGNTWLLLDVEHSGAVWVSADALTGASDRLPDLATPEPQPTARVVIVQPHFTEPAPPVNVTDQPPMVKYEGIYLPRPTPRTTE